MQAQSGVSLNGLQTAGELLVDAGKRKYRVHMREVCPELGTTSAVAFRGDGISQRICAGLIRR